MDVWKQCLGCVFFASLFSGSSLQQDTVTEDVSVRQVERLVELLTSRECERLLFTLSHPEENIFLQLERLSAENNQLDIKPRAKRDATSAEDSAAQCRAALTDWLLKYGEQTHYDRLSRALQHVGRTDIAIELGKNINQDKTLNLKRYVEDYHNFVMSLNVPSVQLDVKEHQDLKPRVLRRKVRDLTWQDLDLVVQRAAVPQYQKGPLDVALPLLLGVLLGFGGTFLAGAFILLPVIHISRRDRQSHRPGVAAGSSRKPAVKDVVLTEVAFGNSVYK